MGLRGVEPRSNRCLRTGRCLCSFLLPRAARANGHRVRTPGDREFVTRCFRHFPPALRDEVIQLSVGSGVLQSSRQASGAFFGGSLQRGGSNRGPSHLEHVDHYTDGPAAPHPFFIPGRVRAFTAAFTAGADRRGVPGRDRCGWDRTRERPRSPRRILGMDGSGDGGSARRPAAAASRRRRGSRAWPGDRLLRLFRSGRVERRGARRRRDGRPRGPAVRATAGGDRHAPAVTRSAGGVRYENDGARRPGGRERRRAAPRDRIGGGLGLTRCSTKLSYHPKMVRCTGFEPVSLWKYPSPSHRGALFDCAPHAAELGGRPARDFSRRPGRPP